jgi:NAD kinase
MEPFEKIVVITKKTPLEELIQRFNTPEQARFYLEHMGASFEEYEAQHRTYAAAIEAVKGALPQDVRHQFVDRSFLPTFLFGERELVITLGPDGLVINTAKYLSERPLLALNPDPHRIDGVLIPFTVDQAADVVNKAVRGQFDISNISMAKAQLNDGQTLYAVNDLFIGQRTHVSARYRLRFRDRAEDQSSSGIIVSTGAGSTGWFRSILAGAGGVVASYVHEQVPPSLIEDYRFDWSARYVYFSVREPFVSKTSSAQIVLDRVDEGESLEITSYMPQNGVIFSDGIEADYLGFNSGAIAQVGLAEKSVKLIAGV